MKRLLILYLLIVPADIYSQLSGNNLFEYQLGNSPGSEPADLSTQYNRLNLNYRYKLFRASVSYEHFVHPDQQKEYYKLTKYSIVYRDKGLSLKLGHFNETLGNGILLRSYEIPASIFEDQAYRVRQGFYRDLKGINLKYDHKYFSVSLLSARSLLNVLPATFDDDFRRPDLSEALEIAGKIKTQRAGFIVMRNKISVDDSRSFASFFASGNIIENLSYSAEIARDLDTGPLFRLKDESALGFYSSLNYSIGRSGLSLEVKDYRNIFIGSGISDPPTLVREQNYRVLNRSTHVTELINERGLQAEAFFGFENESFLTLNYTFSENDFGKKFTFSEYFAEYQFSIRDQDLVKFFIDYSEDPLRLEFHRYSSGFLYEPVFTRGYSGVFQFEYQHFVREDFLNAKIRNGVFIIGGHSPGHSSLSIIYEISTDPNQTDDNRTLEIERERKQWIGIDASFKINKANKINLFAGSRRGGPACTSGICYEVLDFKGVEFRLTTKF